MNQEGIDFNQFQQMSLQEKLAFASQLHEQLNLDEAKQVFETILVQYPDCVEAIDHYTDILEENGEVEKLQTVLKNLLVEKNKDLLQTYESTYKLFFKYAQTQDGERSIEQYKYGVILLESLLKKHSPEFPKWLLKDIGDAYAAMAEVYQSDLLHLKSSEKSCQQSINLAFQYDPTNLDAFLQLANFHLNKEDEEEAKKDLRFICERVNETPELEQDFLMEVGKLLVELEQFILAEQVMRRAVDMDEKNVEALYMLAFSLWKLGQYAESMSICDGINSIPTAKDDEEVYTATQELITELLNEKIPLNELKQDDEEEWMDME